MSIEFMTEFKVVTLTDDQKDDRLMMGALTNPILFDFFTKVSDSEYVNYDDEDEEEDLVQEEEDKFKALICIPFYMSVDSITHIEPSVAFGYCAVTYYGVDYIVAGKAEEISKMVNEIRVNNLKENYKLKQKYGANNND